MYFWKKWSSLELKWNVLVFFVMRLLGYYSVCLFLRYNQSANNIDGEIASFITVMIRYPTLDESGWEQV